MLLIQREELPLHRYMKRRCIQRMFLAWLLLATILPMLVVKSIHHHDVPSHISTEQTIHSLAMEHTTHFCATDNGCPICHFIVSPYTEAETYQFHSVVPYSYLHRPVIHEQETSFRLIYSHGLRAPPFLLNIA